MGRVGSGAYDKMRELHGDTIVGIEFDTELIKRHQDMRCKVLLGDPSPEMLIELSSTGNRNRPVYNYDMSTELYQSGQDYVHKTTYELHPMRLPDFEETGP